MRLSKLLFPLMYGFSFAEEEGGGEVEEETKEETKVDPQANIQQVQALIEAARKEEQAKMQRLVDEAEEKYSNQVKRAKKSEESAKHTDEANEEVANLKERLRLSEENSELWKKKAANSTENNISSHITSAVSKVAVKLVDPNAESTLQMRMRPFVAEGKSEDIVVLGKDGEPRLKQDESGKIIPLSLDDLAREILDIHTYLLASTSKGGSGSGNKRDGIQTTTIDKVKLMEGEELSQYMKTLSAEEQKAILDQI